MARFSVAQTDNEDQTIADINWEEESYQQGFAFAREQARLRLEALDAELLRGKPKGWTVLGFRERTMVTNFGEEVIRRRLYRDPDGQSRFALDEHFGWESHQQASPSLTESIVTLSAQMPPYQVRGRLFGKTATTVSALTADVLSTSTVYRLLRAVGQSAIDDERSRWEACFERGEDVCEGEQRVDVLYTEADGVWVHLQREERTHYEVKSGIANRMKKRGMSWTIRGAHRMAKVVQLVHNGELAEFCRNQTRRRRSARHRLEQPSRQGSEVVSKTRVSDWAAASVPALSGPHCSRPWTNSLRNLVQPTHLLN